MRVVVSGRNYDVPEGAEVTISFRFSNGSGISLHPTGDEPPAPTIAAIVRDPALARTLVPGSMGSPKKPGTGRKACPKCKEVCGASLRTCPGRFCDHVFVKAGG